VKVSLKVVGGERRNELLIREKNQHCRNSRTANQRNDRRAEIEDTWSRRKANMPYEAPAIQSMATRLPIVGHMASR